MTLQTQERRSHGFAIGLLTGTFVGAGLAMWLAPRMASELRERITDSVKGLGLQASEKYEQTSGRVSEAVSELARRGQDARADVADAGARGAHKVERYAIAAKSDRVGESPVARNEVSRRKT